MIFQIWISQLVLAIAAAIPGNEVLPEKYLKPRDFNYHPYIDLGTPASRKKNSALLNDAYAILKGIKYSNQNLLFYPSPHSLALQKKYETNEAPKNYAFTYRVKDQLSGDDFSHSQAHTGKGTKGQYKVKLPDGRTQIVSYTADHEGYRADVQYEDNVTEKTSEDHSYQPFQIGTPLAKFPQTEYKTYHEIYVDKNGYPINSELASAILQTLSFADKSKPFRHTPGSVTYSPPRPHQVNDPTLVGYGDRSEIVPQYYHPQDLAKFVSSLPPHQQGQYVSPTVSPTYFASTVSPQYVSSTISPQYVSSTVSPQYVLSTVSPQYVSQQYVSTTPPYSGNHVGPTQSPENVYPNYPSALHHSHVYVTPSPI